MRNEEDFIEDCLASLREQDYPADRMEIIVLDGESTDRSPEIVNAIAQSDPRVRLLPNPNRTQADGLNIGITAAVGEIIVRADAHATYGPAYIPTCVGHLVAGRADNVGGLQRGVGRTPFGRAVAAALSTKLGAGNAPYRLATEVRYADTVWLGAWYRKTLQELGGFKPEMVPNEDYELNCRLRKRGGRVLLDPGLPSTYYPRISPARLWRQYFRYGQAKVRTLRAHPDTLVLRQLLAPALVVGIIVTALCIPLSYLPFIVLTWFYLHAIFLGSLHTAIKAGWGTLVFLPLIFISIHFAWGFGFLWGLLRHGGFPLRPGQVIAAERLVRKGE